MTRQAIPRPAHVAAITQLKHDCPGRDYYLRKRASGKGHKEALRCLKRRLSDVVYRYALQHPGEVYFPFHQTSTYLAEHKFSHSDWGLMNLIAGHFPVTKEDVLRNISPTAHLVAYPPDTPVKWLEPYLFPSHHVVRLSGLPGFNVFAIER
jgi:hypothetical protein